jgi:spore coat protein U-like protein
MTKPILMMALAAIVPVAAMPDPVSAAGAGATAQAVVIRRLSLVNTQDLDFGTLVTSPVAGTATINPVSGARTVGGGVAAAGGTPSRAEFVGAGQIGLLSFIALGAPPVLSNGTGGTMPSTLSLDGPGIRVLPGTGVQTIGVGGTINVGANQQEGNYTGTFTLTVNYL